MKKYEELWKAKALEENINDEEFDVNSAWGQHHKEITARRGEIVTYKDLNKDQLPNSK